MERVEAMRVLGKILGPKFGFRIDKKAPKAEERASAYAQLQALADARKKANEAAEDRKKELLASDAQYQSLLTDYKTAREAFERSAATARRFKITVGKTVAGMFFSVTAEGDSWEDVIAKLKSKKVTV